MKNGLILLLSVLLCACGGGSDHRVGVDVMSPTTIGIQESASPSAQSSDAGANTSLVSSAATVINYKERSMLANFSSFDESGCVATSVTVAGAESYTKAVAGGGTAVVPFALVAVESFDLCNLVSVVSAFGFTETVDLQFQVSLSEARLQAVIPSFDGVTGNTIEFQVNVTWTATGPVAIFSDAVKQEFQNSKILAHFAGGSRQANAVGSISDGLKNFAPGASDYAEIQNLKRGQVTVVRRE